MEWYIVKFNYNCLNNYNEHKTINYYGLDGDIWPITSFDYYKHKYQEIVKCYEEINKSMEYIELKKNYFIHVSTNLELACQYSKLLEKYFDKEVIILNVSNNLERTCDGFDFGNPEGGYSIIFSEILQNEILREKHLNVNGLFPSVRIFQDFIETCNINEIEDLDDYFLLSIRVVKINKREYI